MANKNSWDAEKQHEAQSLGRNEEKSVVPVGSEKSNERDQSQQDEMELIVGSGIEPQDVQLTYDQDNHLVTVTGRRVSEDKSQANFFSKSWFSFSQTFRVPEEIKREDISTFFENGVLKVSWKPKSDQPASSTLVPDLVEKSIHVEDPQIAEEPRLNPATDSPKNENSGIQTEIAQSDNVTVEDWIEDEKN